MENELNEMIEFYQQEKIQIHIELFSGKYYNGLIIENSKNHIIILDRKIGKVYIAFSEVKIIEKFIGRNR